MKSQESKATGDDQSRGKKPYSAPQLAEHGSIEDITGTPTGDDSSISG